MHMPCDLASHLPDIIFFSVRFINYIFFPFKLLLLLHREQYIFNKDSRYFFQVPTILWYCYYTVVTKYYDYN